MRITVTYGYSQSDGLRGASEPNLWHGYAGYLKSLQTGSEGALEDYFSEPVFLGTRRSMLPALIRCEFNWSLPCARFHYWRHWTGFRACRRCFLLVSTRTPSSSPSRLRRKWRENARHLEQSGSMKFWRNYDTFHPPIRLANFKNKEVHKHKTTAQNDVQPLLSVSAKRQSNNPASIVVGSV